MTDIIVRKWDSIVELILVQQLLPPLPLLSLKDNKNEMPPPKTTKEQINILTKCLGYDATLFALAFLGDCMTWTYL